MNEGQSLPPAGWYPDPEGRQGQNRYWDGSRWTERYAPSGSASAAGSGGPGAAKERGFGSLELIAGIFFVLGWLTIILGSLITIGLAIEAGNESTDVFGGDDPEPGGVIVGGALIVFIYSLMFFAASAFIRLLLAVEDNTRRTAERVEALAEGPGRD